MKINIPTRGEVDLEELSEEASEMRVKNPNIVVAALIRDLNSYYNSYQELLALNDRYWERIKNAREALK